MIDRRLTPGTEGGALPESQLSAQIRKTVPSDLLPIFAGAYDLARAAGSSDGVAMVHGFAAIRPSRPIVKQRCRLELFRKERSQQVFYAWASVVEKDGQEVVDHEGMSWSEGDMERAAWEFTARSGEHGISHEAIAPGSELVASIPFTKDLQQALGIDLGRVGWLVGFHVADEGLWHEIDSGNLPMMSIGGVGMLSDVQSGPAGRVISA